MKNINLLMSYKFSRKNRLKKKQYFQLFNKINNKYIDKYMIFIYQYTKDISQLGLIIKKKYVPSSVCRNFYKRLVREYFRLHKDKIKLKVIIIAKKNLYKCNKWEIKKCLQKFWQYCMSMQTLE